MASYTTKDSFNLVSQVMIQGSSANVDYLYGPYETTAAALEKISTLQRQAGKTVGIIENGKVVEYWLQPNDSGVLEFVQKQKQADAYTKAEVDEKIDALGSVFNFKGQVADMAALNAIDKPSVGDVYHVLTTDSGADAEYVYVSGVEGGTAAHWEELGTTLDLSGYATKTAVDASIADINDKMIEAIDSSELTTWLDSNADN